MERSHCTRCGRAVEGGAFCSACGAPTTGGTAASGPILASQVGPASSTVAPAVVPEAAHRSRTPFLLTVVGVLTVIVIALAVVVAKGSGSKPTSVQVASPTEERTTPSTTAAPGSTAVTSPTTAPAPPSTSPPPPAHGKDDALAVIASRGMHELDSRAWDDSHKLRAIQAIANDAANPRGARYFFFVDGDLVGTDDLTTHEAEGTYTSSTDDSITLTYAVYRPADGLCCPSGGAEQVTYHWDGSTLTAARSATIPPSTTTTTRAPAPRSSTRTYQVTHDVTIRTGPGTAWPSVGEIPAGTWVTVSCAVQGEVIDDIWGPDPWWDYVSYVDSSGYITDEWVDTQNDVKDRSIIPACYGQD